ncbi:hypothetical protein APR08_003606 [Nocardia amikacinitolerans]|nr:hypothetical protein [Nocardia amikacinitolerans]
MDLFDRDVAAVRSDAEQHPSHAARAEHPETTVGSFGDIGSITMAIPTPRPLPRVLPGTITPDDDHGVSGVKLASRGPDHRTSL